MKNKRLYVEGFEAKELWTQLDGNEEEVYNDSDLYIAIKCTHNDPSEFMMIDFDSINEDGESDLGESGEPNIIVFKTYRF